MYSRFLHLLRGLYTLLVCIIAYLPVQASAQAPSIISITPPANGSPYLVPVEDPPGVYTFGLYDDHFAPEATYDIVISLPSEPRFFSVRDGTLNSYTYNSSGATLSANITFTESVDLALAGQFSITIHTGTSSIPPIFEGIKLSSDSVGFGFIDPSEESPAFGVTLYGPSGSTPTLRLFLPRATIDTMETLHGKELTIEDLEVYADTESTEATITSAGDGGVIVDYTATMSSSVILSPFSYVSKQITVGVKAEPPVLTTNRFAISKGNKVRFVVQADGCANGDGTALLYRKIGALAPVLLRSVSLDESCAGRYVYRPTKTANYHVTVDGTESSPVKVRILKK